MADPDTTLMNTSGGVPPYESPKSPQYPPLSERPVDPCARMPTDNPIDKVPLEKFSPRADPEEKLEKDVSTLIVDTVDRLTFALAQAKHQKAVQTELKALLEHEKKILTQISDRATKFSTMKEENKKKIDEWEAEHNQRIPFYTQYLKELMEIPENECLNQEGVPTAVGQKILYSIVEKTSHIANNAIVQLSMQNTLVNDIDLSLAKLRQFCAVMLRNIEGWLKMLNTQMEHQSGILDLWERIKTKIKQLKEMTEEEEDTTGEENGNGTVPKAKIKALEARVLKLESTVDVIQGSPPATGGSPTTPTPGPSTPPAPPAPQQSPGGAKPRSRSPRSASPQGCPQQFPTGADYFGPVYNTRTPPDPNASCIPPVRQDAPRSPGGRIIRRRASPGCPQRMDLADMFEGTPFPREAIEMTSVHRQQPPIPIPQPSPVPPKQGRFMPVSASTPKGTMRDPWQYEQPPSCPGTDQPVDPATLPKIQEDLQNLSKKNKKLEKLVNEFREMRHLLTEEMDKAVRLNQKLQRDLYYVAQEANKQPQ